MSIVATIWNFVTKQISTFKFVITRQNIWNFITKQINRWRFVVTEQNNWSFKIAPGGGYWILRDGYWDDGGIWIDGAIWKDG